MKLLGSNTSPYVRKVRVVLAEKKLDVDFVTEDVWSADTTIADANPLGKVPCLIMEGGEALFDSRVIVEYLDTLSPVGKLIPVQGRERAEVKTWEALADGLSTCPMSIDDALADLVADDAAEYKQGVGYRLKGTVLCREAMRMLKRERVQRAVKAAPFDGMWRIGVAEHRPGYGLVMYELELPEIAITDGPKYQQQINAILKFTTKEIDRV